MGYIKKLKSNELVGGTDKTTIYPVTSAEAVFEEITNGNESSFKSQKTINKEQQDELDNHEERIQAAEAEDIKSITINGSTKKFEVDDENNVDLTIYTVDSDPDMPDIADNVRDLRNMVGTSTPVLETSHKTRIENLEATVGTGGTVDQRISDAVTIEKNRAEGIEGGLQTQINGKQKTLSVGTGITLTQDGVISATADPSVAKVVETLPTGDDIVDGLIYLVKTSTAGTYSQHVHSTSGWSSNLPNVSLGITADDAIDSTSTNPIQNDAITAQIGYFVCGDSNGSSATKNVDAPSYSPSDVGGAFKIKMNYANTSTDTVYLRFNSDDTTKKELRYNREAVTPNNSWDAGEVISVYYDGTYYQASNAMGGGSAAGKKVINPTATNRAITTNGNTIGAVITSGVTNWCYAKYAVNESDVVMISGTGGSSPRLWAIADASENILSKEETINVTREDFVLVMPADAKWIVLNNNGNEYPDYKWLYAKAGSEGARELVNSKKIDNYLYGNLRTLALGHTYYEAESLKTTDRQFLQMTKPVMTMNITDEVAVGDLKVYSTFTYKALKAVSKYNGTDTEGLYAIGRPSIVTVTVDASGLSIEQDTDITVTIGEDTQTITVPVAASETKAADIAALIATAFAGIEGWAITDNEDGTLTLKCLTGGANTLTITSDVGETGLVITSSAVNGTNNLSKYTEGVWADVTLANYAADSVDVGETPDDEMWQKIDLDELISTATIQDTLIEKFRVEDLHKSILNISAGVSTTSPVNNKLNLEAGKRYRMVYKLSAPAEGDYKRFYLRQTYSNNTPNVLVGTIDVGQDTLDTFYVPTENENYQYPHTWTTAGSFTYSIYVYEVNYVDKVPRLYDELGKKTDGAVHQKALTEMLSNGTFKTLVEYDVDTAPMAKTRYSINTGSTWLNKNSCHHVVIPCAEGDRFTIKPTGNGNFYGWLADYSTPSAGQTVQFSQGKGKWIEVNVLTELTAPENTKYLCLVTRNGDGHDCVWTGTADIKTPLYDILHEMVRKAQLESMVDEKIEQAEADYTSNLNKHIFTPSSYIPVKEGYSTYWDTGSLCYQGCALYGDYLVCISNSDANRIKICNLRDKTTVASSVALPSFPNTRTHANTLSFSNTKYDNGDPFPLLYICSGYTNTSSTSTSHVYVVRIINNGGTYTTELIQTITLDFGVVNRWTEFVVDAGNNRAWINGSDKAYYICVALPSISESAVTIDNETPLIDSFDVNAAALGVSTKSSGQNRFFYHGRVYLASGVPENTGEGVDALYLAIDNTLTHCREAIVSLKNYGITTEPEACFVWEDDFYVVMRSGAIRKLIQN